MGIRCHWLEFWPYVEVDSWPQYKVVPANDGQVGL